MTGTRVRPEQQPRILESPLDQSGQLESRLSETVFPRMQFFFRRTDSPWAKRGWGDSPLRPFRRLHCRFLESTFLALKDCPKQLRIPALHFWRRLRSLCCVSRSPSLSSWESVFCSKSIWQSWNTDLSSVSWQSVCELQRASSCDSSTQNLESQAALIQKVWNFPGGSRCGSLVHNLLLSVFRCLDGFPAHPFRCSFSAPPSVLVFYRQISVDIVWLRSTSISLCHCFLRCFDMSGSSILVQCLADSFGVRETSFFLKGG